LKREQSISLSGGVTKRVDHYSLALILTIYIIPKGRDTVSFEFLKLHHNNIELVNYYTIKYDKKVEIHLKSNYNIKK